MVRLKTFIYCIYDESAKTSLETLPHIVTHTHTKELKIKSVYKISIVVVSLTQITGSVYTFKHRRVFVEKQKATSTISEVQIYTINTKDTLHFRLKIRTDLHIYMYAHV